MAFRVTSLGHRSLALTSRFWEFATSRFDASFPIFSKIEVNGDNACELYQWLKSKKPNPDGKADIAWNFTKFLIGKDGSVLARFEPQVSPENIGTQLGNFL